MSSFMPKESLAESVMWDDNKIGSACVMQTGATFEKVNFGPGNKVFALSKDKYYYGFPTFEEKNIECYHGTWKF